MCKEGNIQTTPSPRAYICHRCSRLQKSIEPNWFASDYANPGIAPFFLPKLSLVESQLISPVAIQQLIYRRGVSGAIATKGHCCAISSDINAVVDILPRVAADVPIIVIKQAGTQYTPNRDFRVRQRVIKQWLLWLKQNCMAPKFRTMQISEENLNLLPEDAELEGLRTFESEEDVDVALNTGNAQEMTATMATDDVINRLSQTMTRSLSMVNAPASQESVAEHEQGQTNYTGINNPLSAMPSENEAITRVMAELFPTDNSENNGVPVYNIPPLSKCMF
jgi:hypothetical protein